MGEYIASVTQELLHKQEYTTLAQLQEWKTTIEAYVLHGARLGYMYPKKSQSAQFFSFLAGSVWGGVEWVLMEPKRNATQRCCRFCLHT